VEYAYPNVGHADSYYPLGYNSEHGGYTDSMNKKQGIDHTVASLTQKPSKER